MFSQLRSDIFARMSLVNERAGELWQRVAGKCEGGSTCKNSQYVSLQLQVLKRHDCATRSGVSVDHVLAFSESLQLGVWRKCFS